MARRPRAAAQAAAVSFSTPTPNIPDASDEEMADAPGSGASTPREEEDVEGEEEAEEGEEEAGTPTRDSEALSRPSTPARGQSSIPRKRRLGRPPKNKPPDWDAPDEHGDAASDVTTPRRRGGWRGRGFGGGRWGKPRGGPSHITQTPIDKEGKILDIIGDEVALPEDAEGETKVDKLGNLQGGREYRVRVFRILGRGDRLYMLSTEPARCIGFRDSYLFFQKHKQLFKIIIDDAAKRDLISREIIPHSYKGRAIGVVTARSVFREFGAKIVIGGKKIVDDYQVEAARANGDVEGELAVPEDRIPAPGENYDKNRYVAWHGASSVYHSGAPSVPMPNGKIVDGKKRKVIVTGVNWMFEHAREASRFNSTLTVARRQNADGFYDPHTNIMQYPKIMQPTHARWEQLPPSTAVPKILQSINGANGPLTNGFVHHNGDHVMEASGHEQQAESIFPSVRPLYSRNFLIVDTHFVTPPTSSLGIPGPDGDVIDIKQDGLADVPDAIVSELPLDCLKAFAEARDAELNWKSSWATENEDGARARFKVDYNLST
ncbi:MAG: hypothetical protein M1830_002894 [Pleopsidium flavum]|nr:MAG: hypothetical protein M1830_002894 [Pleopsidium flavum]